MSSESLMERWRSEAPALVDLTLPEQDQWARTVAAEMLERFTEPGELERLERGETDAPVLLRLAMKLAQSRRRILSLPGDVRISVCLLYTSPSPRDED